jgi:hypothetical protein
MTPSTITGVLLIALPIAFNVAFTGLARRFGYPGILRQPVGTILEKFSAGGSGLVTLWWVFALVALAFVPVAAAAGSVVRSASTSELGAWLAEVSIAVGVAAGLVQTLGLIRWPYLVPELARRYHGAADPAERRAAEVVFAAAHRLLGVGIGEGLGYLLTGLWTVLFGLSIVASGVVPAILGILALPVGLAVALGTFEFAGSHEPDGWELIGSIVPVAYIAWSIWLLAVGVCLVLGLR